MKPHAPEKCPYNHGCREWSDPHAILGCAVEHRGRIPGCIGEAMAMEARRTTPVMPDAGPTRLFRPLYAWIEARVDPRDH